MDFAVSALMTFARIGEPAVHRNNLGNNVPWKCDRIRHASHFSLHLMAAAAIRSHVAPSKVPAFS